jgi:AraC-like DNA-binding protein
MYYLTTTCPADRLIPKEAPVIGADSLFSYPPSNVAEQCPAWVARIMAGESASAPQGGSEAQQKIVANAKRHISQFPGVRMRLADVGHALGVSPVHLTEVFRQVEGTPFYRYALQQRLERAVRLLPGYGGDLSALAFELDFSSHSHFATAFRRAFGCTPATFRERARRICRNVTSLASRRVETPNRSVAAHPAHPATA